ncbi:hypothetical protein QBZ16_002308 [Prototheca wickerhamii]|uniref:G-patch domain-containing protein n=1 Tax=Prototheca wickerhamii TaxID=3111 RepID=A0AAD9IKD7_PROWI|nr:hypothetical protein QBZ16_002308 [Prototheca wickerhamii]
MQEVKDEQGRRRFHGAFTGGFSAGYYNTAGSQEGWAPSAFRSSRDARASSAPQSIEQFLDEDELEEHRRQRLQTTAEYDTFGATAREATRRAAAEADNGRPAAISSFLAEQVLAPVSSGAGVRLLRRMGWREGRGLGPADAAGPTGVAEPRGAEDEASSSRLAETPIYLLEPKTDLYGVGYNPFRGATEFAAAKRARLQAGRAASGATPSARRKHHGIAFGTGVMDEDDSYGIMEDYVTTEEVAGELESARADARGLPARRAAGLDRHGLGDRLAAEGYTFEIQEEEEEEEEEAHRPVETRSFPPPTLPPGWRPRPPSEVRGTGPDPAQPSHAPPAAPPTDPKLRQAIDTTAFYVARNGKIFENMARRQQEKAIEAGEGEGHAFLLGGAGAAYYAAKLAAVRALLAAPGEPARDRGKGAEEPRPRAAPLSSAERGALLGEQPLPPGERSKISPPTEAPPASAQHPVVPARSVLGSVAEADRLRLAGLLKSSFVSAGAGAAAPRKWAGCGRVPARRRGREAARRLRAPSDRLPVRSGRDWRPEPLLCKRLNVADPYRGRPRELVMPSSRTDFLALPATAAEAAQSDGRSAGAGALAAPASDQAFVEDGDAIAGEMPDADSFLASILSAGADEGTAPPLPPAPPVDVFKAIFEDDDDDDEAQESDGDAAQVAIAQGRAAPIEESR